MKRKIALAFIFLVIGNQAQSQVAVAKIFSDNMVLQRNGLIPVWGTAKANEKITVLFHNQTKLTKADKNGNWMIRLDNELAGGPYNLIIKGKQTIEIKNVLVGEVWLCSGQSNMEWSVSQSDNAKNEIADADNYFNIRHIKIEKSINSIPNKDLKNSNWTVCNAANVPDYTGIGYFFAKELYNKLHVPIGIINSSWGGTNIETWISRDAFESSPEFKEMITNMPKVSLDSLSKLKGSDITKRIEKLQDSKLDNSNTNAFKNLSYNDLKWPEINEPEVWEQQSLGDFDGVVWLRKTITLTAEDVKTEGILELSKIDDDDETYVNGIKVGATNGWDLRRKYKILVGILKEGKNVIAVRVVDGGGGGGIYGDSKDLKLTLGIKAISLVGKWKFQVESIKKAVNENSFPSLCFNSMIYPLIPFAYQGVLWYQGESNASRANQYRKAFPLLINNWRQKWNQPKLPFYFVQLASFTTSGNSNEGCGWAELREAQTQTLQLPNTAMVVSTDLVVNPKDIHPTNKLDVGKRFAALALNNLYNTPTICNGPIYKSIEIDEQSIIVSFDNIGSGLYTTDKYGYVKGFEIAGNDKKFYFAKAIIKDNKVVLSNEKVTHPIAVHYSWIGDATESNLFNKEGFPAVPFRTDDWKTVTKEAKYKIEKIK